MAWLVFATIVACALAADAGVLRRSRVGSSVPSRRAAAIRSVSRIALSVGFGAGMWVYLGREPAVTYFTAYVVEKSLSLDNLLVFVLIFAYLDIPAAFQRGVLLWGVIGALVLRALLILSGIFVISRFHRVIYPFAGLLLFAAVRLLWGQERQREIVAAACSICSTWVAKIIPVTPVLYGTRFVARDRERLVATPLFVALVVVETTDIVFALDSIPAALAMSRDPFIVFTSNIFAMLGLRSLYFLLSGFIGRLRYLKVALAVILAFTASKMHLAGLLDIPNEVSLGVIAVVLSIAIVLR